MVPEAMPECAVCGKPVDRVVMTDGYRPDTFRYSKRYRVECHGQVEEFELDEKLLVSARRIVIGKAFVQKPALPEGE